MVRQKQIVVGYGSESSLGLQFTGKYFALFINVAISSFSLFPLELEILGTTLGFVVYWFRFNNALVVAKADSGLRGAIAVG